jgi:hypothetical protein
MGLAFKAQASASFLSTVAALRCGTLLLKLYVWCAHRMGKRVHIGVMGGMRGCIHFLCHCSSSGLAPAVCAVQCCWEDRLTMQIHVGFLLGGVGDKVLCRQAAFVLPFSSAACVAPGPQQLPMGCQLYAHAPASGCSVYDSLHYVLGKQPGLTRVTLVKQGQCSVPSCHAGPGRCWS